jgi:hypothetical protein
MKSITVGVGGVLWFCRTTHYQPLALTTSQQSLTASGGAAHEPPPYTESALPSSKPSVPEWFVLLHGRKTRL